MPRVVDGRVFCPRCLETKDVSEFHPHRSRVSGVQAYCKTCSSRYQQGRRREDPHMNLYWNAVSRARAKGKPIDITPAYVAALLQSGTCAYCRRAVSTTNTRADGVGHGPGSAKGNWGASHDSATLDCVVPALGYVVGNTVVCDWACNRAKGNMSYDEWREHTLSLASWMEWRPEAPTQNE